MAKYNYFDDSDESTLADILDRVRAESNPQQQQRTTASRGSARGSASSRSASNRRNSGAINIAKSALSKNPFDELENATRNKKRVVAMTMAGVFLVFLVLLVLVTVLSVHKENKQISKFSTDAGSICSQYLGQYGNTNFENLMDKYNIEGCRMTGLCCAREIDFDNNGKSELLLGYYDGGLYYTEVWGYVDKKFSVIYHEKATNVDSKSVGNAWITLYFRHNKTYIGQHDEKDLKKVELFGMHHNKFEKDYDCTFNTTSGAFSVKGKKNRTDFERIKFAVINQQKANEILNRTNKTVNGFSMEGGDGAAKATAFNASLKGSYYRVVEELNQKYGKAEYVENGKTAFIKGLAVVDLIDFNNDGTEELFLIYRKQIVSRDEDEMGYYVPSQLDKYYVEIYRYNGSGAVLAYKNEGISNDSKNERDRYFILKHAKNRTYYCQNTYSESDYGNSVTASSTIMKFNKTTFVSTFSASYQSDYGYTTYYIDDSEVYSSQFESEANKVPLFNGNDVYNENDFTVTYLQRKARDAGSVESQVNKTVNNIKKLNASYDPDV
ncbi:MAG: hypothetical protein IJR60_03545 [Eubacterium sp.]|nr:hypothetical protein [Eubacterium sp.]